MNKFIRNLIPQGLIEFRRDRLLLERYGLAGRGRARTTLEGAIFCRYELWPKNIRNTKEFVLVDVGANEGDFTRAVMAVTSIKSIIAVEPQKHCCDKIRQMVASIPTAKVVEAAAGAENGSVQFNRCRDDKLSSVLEPSTTIQEKYPSSVFSIAEIYSVPLKRLDDIVPDNLPVSLLKIDVQGYESAVLKGASRLLTQTRAVLIEVNYQDHYDGESGFTGLHNQLVAAGFRLNGISAPFFGGGDPLWGDAVYANRAFETEI